MSKTQFKPMLAASPPKKFTNEEAIDNLPYPVIASPKLDGIRCVVPNGKVLSRSLKPIPNRYVQKCLSGLRGLGELDGELMVTGNFQDVTSGIMSHDGQPKFTFTVFDWFGRPELPYSVRIREYERQVDRINHTLDFKDFTINYVDTQEIRSAKEMRHWLGVWLEQGYEGAIVRDECGAYKFGRSTWKEGGMIKVKPFEDAEAKVIGFVEQQENTNEKTVNELGRSKRSSAKAGKVGKGTLGKFIVTNKEFGEFKVGTGIGLTDEVRQEIWNNQKAWLGKTMVFKFQRIGTMDKPRLPIFKGWRHPHDK